ncbi:MAG: serine--tRNA ligase [Nanoarchaeota archaeon]|nr:serine--tRNA ligase [Nanoarchaeota archaeon]
MLSIRFIRENADVVKKSLKQRKDIEKINWVDEVLAIDEKWLSLKQEVDELRRRRNEIAQEINSLKKEGKDTSKKIKEAKDVPGKIKTSEEELEKLEEKRKYFLMRIPNVLHESVPYGKDDSENVEVKKVGKMPKFSFELKAHGELVEGLGIADFKRATKIAGSGFNYLKGELVLLDIALQRFAIDFLVKKGYTLVYPPFMMNRKSCEGVTDLADFENVMYKVEDEDLYMIATSEHPMGAMFMDEVIDEKDLPLKFCGLSACFRKEIGSHGVDTRGLFRMHQFNKVEQFIFCKPEDSWKLHEELQKNSEVMFKELGIPFRVVNICTGDIGIVAAKKFDIEAWFPRSKEYKEVGSNSNCTSYQAIRLNIRYDKKDGERNYVHTLNNTGIATSRVMVAILENYQQKDGSVKIPKVLQKYMYSKKFIGKPEKKTKKTYKKKKLSKKRKKR